MKNITDIAVTGEDGVVTYAGGSKEEFQCSGTIVTITVSLVTTPEKECGMRIATGGRLRHMYTHDSDIISRGLNGTSATSAAPTIMGVEFMCLVRAVASKYGSALPDVNPRTIALGVLRYVPIEVFSAVHPTPVSGIQLDQATGILEQVGGYMKTNNIALGIISARDAIRNINVDSATF